MGLAETAQLAVRIGLDDKLSPGLRKMSGNLGKFEGSAKRIGGGIGKLAGGIAKVGIVAGVAVAGGLALAAKKAGDFDDAFAAVRKNVEGSPGRLNDLNTALHNLATRVPVPYQDLAAIAAEAGALGVAAPDVAHFTEVIARLSASTQGLTVEAASEAFGKFRNILHLTGDQMDRAASSLIALGKGGASSEGDIIEISKRFAGAGSVAGLSASQILALSSAIASVGVAPEAAGSSLSRLFNNITKYIGTGDKKIKQFASTTHQSVAAFSKGFKKDATGTVLDFLTELSKLDKFKQAAVLKNAGITNTRDIAAVQLLSQNLGEVRKQLKLADKAFKDNTDLTDTSNKRFDTFNNKVKLLGQNFDEAKYQLAEGFLPALGRAVDKTKAFLQLDSTKSQLRSIGQDLGKAIDRIDFNKLLTAAQGVAKAFDPALQALLKIVDLISSLPPGVVGAGAGLVIANKISGGAITAGLGDIIGGLGSSLVKNLASQIPVFGKAFVQPVFVTNMGGLPGLPGAGGAAEGLGAAAKVGATAGAGIVITDMHAFNQDLADRLSHGQNADSPFAQTAAAAFGAQAAKETPWDKFLEGIGLKQATDNLNSAASSLDTVTAGARDGDKNLPSSAAVLQNLGDIGINLGRIADGQKELPSLKRQLSDVTRFEASARKRGDTEAIKLWGRVAKALRTDIATIHGHGPKDKDGNLVTNAIHRLRNKLTLTIEREGRAERDGRTKTAKLLAGKEEAIRAAIRRLEAPYHKDPAGPTPRDMDKHLASPAAVLKNLQKQGINLGAIAGHRSESLKPTLHQLRERLAAVLRQEGRAERRGNTQNANHLAHRADLLKSRIDAASRKNAAKQNEIKEKQAATTRAARATAAAIRAKKLAVTVKTTVNANTSVSVSAIQRAARVSSRVARTTSLEYR